MNGENELPEGWAATTVGFFFKIVGGGTPSTKKVEYWDGTIPWITSADISGFQVIPRKNVTELGVKESATKIVPEKSIIVVTRVGLGKIALAEKPLCFSQDCHALITKDMPIDPKYALFFLSLEVERFRYENRGTTITGVTVKQLSDLPLLLPPLAEQRRIVAAVEALLARVNASRERLDRVPGFLKAFRQAVLAAACSGRLTEGWRGVMNLEPDKNSLLETIELINKERNDIPRNKKIKSTNNIEVNFNIPEIWCKVSLKEISYKITDGEHATPKRSESGYYLLSARNVLDGKISLNNVDYVPFEEFTRIRKRCNPDKGDILISCSGTIGRVTVVDKDNSYVMVRSAALVKPFFSIINPKYLEFILRSQILQDQMGKRAKATAQSNLFIGEIEKLVIPLAPLEEQEEIVRRVEALFALADHIEQRVAIGKERADRLTQAILAKAFRGELVPTEAELARRAGREYEPASVLLERIRMDRESPGERKPRTRGIRSTKGVQ